MKKFFFILVSIILPLGASAKLSNPCNALPWIYEKPTSVNQFKAHLDSLNTPQILGLMFGQYRSSKPDPQLLVPMHLVLGVRAKYPLLRGYHDTMIHFMTGDNHPSDAIKRWPKIEAREKYKMPFAQACDLYKKTLAQIESERAKK